MDEDSSSKFIGSLTKFLQSLCNGYVEFQKGVELVGHIYLNIDTGEKVDYILHEKVSKNDENSVSFVSNSFHAQPLDNKNGSRKKDSRSKAGGRDSAQASDDDDDDIMIVDQSERMPGSTNTGTVPNKGVKRMAGPGSANRLAQHAAIRSHNQSSSSPLSSQAKYRQQQGVPSATVTNQTMQQDNISIGDVKLEQLSADELLSLASQVDEGASSSHVPSGAGLQSQTRQGSHSVDSSRQPVWIKQEAPDDSQSQGGHDTGWPRSRDGQSDSSNSGSDLYPVMMHQNPGYSSSSVFPGFSSTSGHSSASSSQHPGHSQNFPGMSGAYASPGTSQGMGGIDPAVGNLALYSHLMGNQCLVPGSMICRSVLETQRTRNTFKIPSSNAERERRRDYKRRSRQRIRENPARLQQYLHNHRMHNKKYYEKKKLLNILAKQQL